MQDGNGFINRQELAVVMGNLGERLSPQEIQGIIDEADVDGMYLFLPILLAFM